MIRSAKKAQWRLKMVALLVDYRNRAVAIAWQDGHPVFIKTGGSAAVEF
jgi:hypothetical protein